MKLGYDPKRDIPDLAGKVFLVTGGTAGLGKSTVVQLSNHNPEHIYFTGRNSQAAEVVIAESKGDSAKVTFIPCDLDSLNSVSKAAENLLKQSENQLDVLTCNAGIMAVPPGVSKDGYEIQFAVNHLAHALLMKRCLPALQRAADEKGDARIVSPTLLGFKSAPKAGIIFKDLKSSQKNLGMAAKFLLYGQSKLENIVYASQLSKRHPKIKTVAIHPGVIYTGLIDHMGRLERFLVKVYSSTLKRLNLQEGAYNTLWAATSADKILQSGNVYEPVGNPVPPTKQSADKTLAEELWSWTEKELAVYS